MKIGMKYRIYPNKTQQIQLTNWFGQQRWIWNLFLDRRKKQWDNKEKFSTSTDMRQLTQIKKTTPWLDAPAQSYQQTLRQLDIAYSRFFNKISAFPVFKNRHQTQSFCVPQTNNHIQISKDCKYIQIPKMGLVKIHLHRDITNFSSITISKNKSNQYWVSFCSEINEVTPIGMTEANKIIGIDLGIKDTYTLSDGTKYKLPKSKRRTKKIKQLQQKLARQQKNSKNRDKTRLKLAKIHQKIVNTKRDYIHKFCNDLTNKYDLIGIEDLDVKALQQKNYGSGIQDSSWGVFKTTLVWHTQKRGKHLILADKYFASSKTCSCCGTKNNNLLLSDRSWICDSCGTNHDRDTNAAVNLQQNALSEISRTGTVRIGTLVIPNWYSNPCLSNEEAASSLD